MYFYSRKCPNFFTNNIDALADGELFAHAAATQQRFLHTGIVSCSAVLYWQFMAAGGNGKIQVVRRDESEHMKYGQNRGSLVLSFIAMFTCNR